MEKEIRENYDIDVTSMRSSAGVATSYDFDHHPPNSSVFQIFKNQFKIVPSGLILR